jgi:endonuclease III
LLNQLHEERNGELSLEHLRDLPTEEAKQELYKYKGVGPKTASCVLMFNMKRADFPVDTHVHRVSTRLGISTLISHTRNTLLSVSCCVCRVVFQALCEEQRRSRRTSS